MFDGEELRRGCDAPAISQVHFLLARHETLEERTRQNSAQRNDGKQVVKSEWQGGPQHHIICTLHTFTYAMNEDE